ncbi:MAG: Fimbrial protein precursor [Candidatus Omnitrophica bacterium ADurb.Bin277]|nr:MAG: Fimbrial protein precursor [Candidatus Omnitrophica bacterium ADurb.Bin277]
MNRKGFTLIEVLIVIVIIAILAALILPRILPQTEKAYVSEALQMLGTLKRAQMTLLDVTNNEDGDWLAVASNTDDNLEKLGIKIMEGAAFTYTCDASNKSCTATRTSDASRTITMNATSVSCGSNYTEVKANNVTVGCA